MRWRILLSNPKMNSYLCGLAKYLTSKGCKKSISTFAFLTQWMKCCAFLIHLIHIHFKQVRFEELWKNFNTYTSGEQLLGLPVTNYDCLEKKKCVTTLQRFTLHYQNNDNLSNVTVLIFMVLYNEFQLIDLWFPIITSEKNLICYRNSMACMMQWWVRFRGTMAFCGQMWILRRSIQNFWNFRTGKLSISVILLTLLLQIVCSALWFFYMK